MTTDQRLLIGIETARALADPLRVQIVDFLAAEQMCTCDLVDATGATQSNVSNHLRVLRDAGLVLDETFGRFTYHRLMPGPLQVLADRTRDWAEQAELVVEVKRPCS